MKCYGYSLWLLLEPTPEIDLLITEHNLHPHKAHVTVKTNIETFQDAIAEYEQYVRTRYPIVILSDVKILQKMYVKDDLYGWGLLVHMNIDTAHQAHISIQYTTEPTKEIPDLNLKEIVVNSQLVIADCRGDFPWQWKVFDPMDLKGV